MKLIILDRDGVINQDREKPVSSPEEWLPIPGALEAIARLNQAGYRVVVATNQSGIARGLLDIMTLNSIHQKMHEAAQAVGAEIDAVFFCPHSLEEHCDCRKPQPGMLNAIAQRFEVSLKGIPLVGDSLRDLQAGFVVGCQPFLVASGKGTDTYAKGGLPPGTIFFPDLAAVAEHVLSHAATTMPSRKQSTI